MSLASILLEGYNGYGNTDTINDPVSYLNEAAMECITGLYEASQQYYTDDIYGSASVLMEGSDAGSKLKEMWNKFVTAIKKVIDKFIEKLKSIPAWFKKITSKQEKNIDDLSDKIRQSANTTIKNAVDRHNAIADAAEKAGDPSVYTIPDIIPIYESAVECWTKAYDSLSSKSVEAVTVDLLSDARGLVEGNDKDLFRFASYVSNLKNGSSAADVWKEAYSKEAGESTEETISKLDKARSDMSASDIKTVQIKITDFLNILSAMKNELKMSDNTVKDLNDYVKELEDFKKVISAPSTLKSMEDRMSRNNSSSMRVSIEGVNNPNQIITILSNVVTTTINYENYNIQVVSKSMAVINTAIGILNGSTSKKAA